MNARLAARAIQKIPHSPQTQGSHGLARHSSPHLCVGCSHGRAGGHCILGTCVWPPNSLALGDHRYVRGELPLRPIAVVAQRVRRSRRGSQYTATDEAVRHGDFQADRLPILSSSARRSLNDPFCDEAPSPRTAGRRLSAILVLLVSSRRSPYVFLGWLPISA
jgi:hypothetical protein